MIVLYVLIQIRYWAHCINSNYVHHQCMYDSMKGVSGLREARCDTIKVHMHVLHII